MTIKEAADLLAITKTGVVYHLRAMGDPLAKDERGRIVIDEDTVQRIRERIETAKRKDKPANLAQSEGANFAKTSRKLTGADSMRELLVNQIAVKDNEIEKLHNEIAKLNDQLCAKDEQLANVIEALRTAQESTRAAQALHAAAVKDLLELKAAQTEQKQDEGEEPPTVTVTDSEPEPEEEHKQEDQEQDEQEQEPPKRSFWARIFGRR